MPNPGPAPDTGEDSVLPPRRGSMTGTSRWQKVVGIIGLVVLLGPGLGLFGPGSGGQGRGGHGPGGESPPAEVRQEGDQDHQETMVTDPPSTSATEDTPSSARSRTPPFTTTGG